MPDEPKGAVLELDELWSFVGSKKNKRWIWLALCKQTRQVVACVVGGRGEPTCKQLWQAIPEGYRQSILYGDFWKAYRAVLPDAQHQAVGKGSGLTAHIERFNNTLRQRLARLVRKTLSFSKSEHMHLICLHRFLFAITLRSFGIEPLPLDFRPIRVSLVGPQTGVKVIMARVKPCVLTAVLAGDIGATIFRQVVTSSEVRLHPLLVKAVANEIPILYA